MALSTVPQTLKKETNDANPGTIADCLRQIGLGDVLSVQKQDITQSSASTMTLSPAALVVQSVRVISGAAAAGLRQIGDSGATPSTTVATLSDDGTTLTFEAGVTEAIVVYMQRSNTSLDTLEQPAS
ncbi:MAG TPA: hypothetical protein VLV86_03465 [Vicinamibacterales bacterium]|nr:hypothetical protein [Vicinamibacterales bacterium]